MSAIILRTGVLGRQQIPCVVGFCSSSRRHQSSTSLTAYKRGTGGRASFSGIVATVFGASGFMGRYVVNQLGKIGSQVIIPYRGDDYDNDRLRLTGDLGQVLFFPYNLRDEDSIRKVMEHSNVVINLVGREWETKRFSFTDVHVDGARRIARIAREVGVPKLIHFSSLNASETPQEIFKKGGSKFLISKAHGEVAVREEYPDAIIFRPADTYGAEDRYITYYTSFWRRNRRLWQRQYLPLWKKGDYTIKYPVFVSDIAEGVMQAIKNPDAVGKTYECIGPHSYYLSDLIDFYFLTMRYWDFKRIRMSPIYRLKALMLSYAPSRPPLDLDKMEREHITDHPTGCPTLADLGVKLTRVEDRVPFELKLYKRYQYYYDELGEYPDTPPPPTVS